jgi:DHA1 family tetracycline resistance protein-like MFS transporter
MDRRLFTILMIVFVQIVGASLILPILPLYAQRQFELAPQTITLLVSSFFAAQFLAGPFIGRLSDKYGRLPVLIISQIGTAISFAMLGLAQSVEMLFISRILDGITGGNIIVAQAYVTDITPREQRTQALGYVFAAFGLGFIIGPALGGALSAVFGPRIPFLIAAVAAAAIVIMTWLTLEETLSPQQRQANRSFTKASLGVKEVLNNYPLLLILAIGFVGQFVLGLIQSTFALYGGAVLFTAYSERLTNLGVGLLLAVVGLSQFFTQTYLLKRLLLRFDEAGLVIMGSILRALAMFIFAAITSPWLGVFGSFFFAVGMGVMMPSLQSLATHTVVDELRGGVLGLYQSALSLSTIFSTALGGVLFAISPTTPYWSGGLLAAVTVGPAIILLKRSRASKLEEEMAPSSL